MSTKEEVIRFINGLPNNVTIEDIIKELDVKAKIEKGIQELDNGEYYSHDWVKEKLGKWLN
jgi:predicted transcriptional regulator